MVIGISLRHIKAYKGIKYIPLGFEHNFVSYAGENGVGKSSILEALDMFFNDKPWLINKAAKPNAKQQNIPFICPIIVIEKNKVSRSKKEFEVVSDFFWNLEKISKNEFFDIKEKLINKKITKKSHYLLFLGEDQNRNIYVPLGDKTYTELSSKFNSEIGSEFKNSKILDEIKKLYSYVYIPVEIDLENFTKIETIEMQKVFDKEIIQEIKSVLPGSMIKEINNKLNLFIDNIEKNLEDKYFYDTGDTKEKYITQMSLVNRILETYFQKRVLIKGKRSEHKFGRKISELSSGEKRQALISLLHAFLNNDKEREKNIIIGIDEPENSLHTSLCYEQFQKLKSMSDKHQILTTTHWYGFLPIIDKGTVHFLNKSNYKGQEVINFFHKIDLLDYQFKTKKLPEGFNLKSTNDLVQSIYHSLKTEPVNNWIICEGISDKLYLEYFLEDLINEKNLHIISVGGIPSVKKFYKYLCLPIEENLINSTGKVFCLTDTDNDLIKNDITINEKIKNNITLKRLYNNDNINETSLIKFTEEKVHRTIIETSLNPTVLEAVIGELWTDLTLDIQDYVGNTDIKNIRNFEYLEKIEKEKIVFAKKYIDKHKELDNKIFIPKWINQLRDFFV